MKMNKQRAAAASFPKVLFTQHTKNIIYTTYKSLLSLDVSSEKKFPKLLYRPQGTEY